MCVWLCLWATAVSTVCWQDSNGEKIYTRYPWTVWLCLYTHVDSRDIRGRLRKHTDHQLPHTEYEVCAWLFLCNLISKCLWATCNYITVQNQTKVKFLVFEVCRNLIPSTVSLYYFYFYIIKDWYLLLFVILNLNSKRLLIITKKSWKSNWVLRNLDWKQLNKHNYGFASRTRESGPVFEFADLQHALAVLTVQDVWRCNVIQGIVLQGWRCWVKLGIKGKWVGWAVSGGRANGANSFCSGLHGYGGTLMETILFCPEKQIMLNYFSNQDWFYVYFYQHIGYTS